LTDPQGIALDLQNNTMFITDTGSSRIVKADMGYQFAQPPARFAKSEAGRFFNNRTYFQVSEPWAY
jgi:sugar lactone lactonase YvrE